jgi:SAM-dependent methyltransferase
VHVNHEYLLAAAASHAPTGRILDYGCGDGSVVEAGLAKGLDIWGAETFYAGGHGTREAVVAKGLLGSRIREIEQSGRIPFEDLAFDMIVNNQVFEHVIDMRAVLTELRRVLKPSGTLLSLFPSREVWREGHCGVPFAHRFAPNSRFGGMYVLAMRFLGLGYFHEGKPRRKWANDFRQWLAEYTVYRSEAEIHRLFAEAFEFEHIESDYVAFRLRHRGMTRIAKIARRLRPLAEPVFKRLGFMVIVARPRVG